MRNLMLALLFGWFSTSTALAEPIKLELTDVVQIVSKQNYRVYENALKVYQSKENVTKARMDLLPKLNLWKIVDIVFDPKSAIGMISDLAPFLVPANWYRAKQAKILHQAEQEGYHALWANEVSTAKALYMHYQMDFQLLKHLHASLQELRRIHAIVKTREVLGGAIAGLARDIEIRILQLAEDEQVMLRLLQIEYQSLTFSLGYLSSQEVELVPVQKPTFSDLKPLVETEHLVKVLAISPELRQFNHFLSVADGVKGEYYFSFLGGSSISRGAAGGVFDSLPVTDGLGFGQGATIRIHKSQKKIMEVQKLGIQETLTRQLRMLVTEYNLDIASYPNAKRRLLLAKQAKEWALTKARLGEDLDVQKLVEDSIAEMQAETSLAVMEFRFMTSLDRLDRMIFKGDYSAGPSEVAGF